MRQPAQRIPRRILNRPRIAARSGVAIAKELVRAEFEKQRLSREMQRLGMRMDQCKAEYDHNAAQSVGLCAKLLSDENMAG